MKKTFIVTVASMMLMLCSFAQNTKVTDHEVYSIGFYNQENLFDTLHDYNKNDSDFLPEGKYKWTQEKYVNKLHNMAYALSRLGYHEAPWGCAIIGVSEVENANVLNDLISQPELSSKGYRYIHFEGPDQRGIDCALLYQPSQFKVETTRLVPFVQELEKDSAFYTRGFLTVTGRIADEEIGVIVCHLPSRGSESFYRKIGARQARAVKDELLREHPGIKVLVMGDMNDDPMDSSMVESLGAKAEKWEVEAGEMYNPFYNILDKLKAGTLKYRGKWNLFDQIVVSPNLIPETFAYDEKARKLNVTTDYSTLKLASARVGYRDYLIQHDGKYEGTPLRTTAGGRWLNGYSDHLPVVVFLSKEKK